jgi:hypothetical protein
MCADKMAEHPLCTHAYAMAVAYVHHSSSSPNPDVQMVCYATYRACSVCIHNVNLCRCHMWHVPRTTHPPHPVLKYLESMPQQLTCSVCIHMYSMLCVHQYLSPMRIHVACAHCAALTLLIKS